MEEQLRQMIEQAKRENDEVLVEYLSKSLAHVIEKKKQQENAKLKSQENINQEQNEIKEEKKEIQVEEKKEELEEEKKDKENDEIDKTISNGLSTLTIYKSGNKVLKSPYMDISVKVRNSALKLNLESMLVSIALDEIKREANAVDDYIDALKLAQSKEDIEDLLNFLNHIAEIGRQGETYKATLTNITKQYGQQLQDQDKTYDVEETPSMEIIDRNLELLNMRKDQLMSNKMKDPEDFRDLAMDYQEVLNQLHDLEYTLSPAEKDQLKTGIKIHNTRVTIDNLQAYAKRLEEISDISFEM